MNKLLTAGLASLSLLAAGSALAADLPARTYSKAPVMAPAPVANWTGFYVGAGFGYSFLNNDNFQSTLAGVAFNQESTAGARGWLGTVQVGADYQFAPNWVIGAFADYTWSDINGRPQIAGLVGQSQLDSSWAAGGRLGYVVVPQLLAFVSGGYTQAHFDSFALSPIGLPGGAASHVYNANTRDGWFIGTGYETQISFLPGFTWKTEYRYADYGAKTNLVSGIGANVPFLTTEDITTHTVRSTLNYRFNYGRY